LHSADAQELFDLMGSRDQAILQDHLTIWTEAIIELLEKLKATTPEAGGVMTSEIHYWRDIDRVLDAIYTELNSKFVATTVKICELGREA
jgi:uncharacterized protein YvpB